jgi:hypothetical protein
VETFGERYMIRILECNVQHVSEDIYGQLSGGSLTVKGWLRSLRCFGCFGSLSTGTTTRMVYLQGHVVGYIDLDVCHDYRNDELHYMPLIENRLGYMSGTEAVGLVLVATGVEGEYQRVGIFSNGADLVFLFKPPTYPRSEADISAKTEIETTQFERLAMATKSSGDRSSSSSMLLDSANINLLDNTETPSRIQDEGELMVESPLCDIDGRTSLDAGGEVDVTSTTPFGNEEWLDGEGQSQCAEASSSESQSEDHSLTSDAWYDFEDEKAWVEGVFKII